MLDVTGLATAVLVFRDDVALVAFKAREQILFLIPSGVLWNTKHRLLKDVFRHEVTQYVVLRHMIDFTLEGLVNDLKHGRYCQVREYLLSAYRTAPALQALYGPCDPVYGKLLTRFLHQHPQVALSATTLVLMKMGVPKEVRELVAARILASIHTEVRGLVFYVPMQELKRVTL